MILQHLGNRIENESVARNLQTSPQSCPDSSFLSSRVGHCSLLFSAENDSTKWNKLDIRDDIWKTTFLFLLMWFLEEGYHWKWKDVKIKITWWKASQFPKVHIHTVKSTEQKCLTSPKISCNLAQKMKLIHQTRIIHCGQMWVSNWAIWPKITKQFH